MAFSYCPGHCQHLQLDGCVAALCVGEEPRSCLDHSPIAIHFLSEHKTEPIVTAGIGMQGQWLVAIEVLESWRSAQHRARCFKRLLVVFGPQEIVLAAQESTEGLDQPREVWCEGAQLVDKAHE